jgi:hypothetical protein
MAGFHPGMALSLDSDEDDVPPLPRQLTTELSKSGLDEAKKMQESFMLSQSGTFKVDDFKINKTGLVPDSERERPQSTAGSAFGLLDVSKFDELETLAELGSGASGTVYKARHKPSGTIVAVKQVTILEKAKRDQVVAELRIMRKHLSPWLVALYNAFYEEAKARRAHPTCAASGAAPPPTGRRAAGSCRRTRCTRRTRR